MTFHRSFHSQIEKLRQGRGSQRSGTHPRELRQGRLWSSGIMRACRLLVVRARRVRVILRCPTRHIIRCEPQRGSENLYYYREGQSAVVSRRYREGLRRQTVQGRTWNLKPERGRETRAGPPPLAVARGRGRGGASPGPRSQIRPAASAHVRVRRGNCRKRDVPHCRLSRVSGFTSRFRGRLHSYFRLSAPGMRPRVEAAQRQR